MDMTVALIKIRRNKQKLTKQQIRTLKGQVFSGDIEGAMKGLDKLLARAAAGRDS